MYREPPQKASFQTFDKGDVSTYPRLIWWDIYLDMNTTFMIGPDKAYDKREVVFSQRKIISPWFMEHNIHHFWANSDVQFWQTRFNRD